MRYIKLYFTCMKRSLISYLEYRTSTYIALLSFLISNAASIASIYFIMSAIPDLKGYTMMELGFLYGFSMLPVALDHLFSNELWLVAYFRVVNGDMDRHFLRPVPVLFQVIAENFQPEGFGELIVGIAMISLTIGSVTIDWSFGVVLLMVVAIVFGAIIITALKTMFAALAFLVKKSGFLLQIVYNFMNYTRYPLAIYPAFLRAILTFVLPFGLFISLPVQALFDASFPVNPYLLSLGIIGFAVVFGALGILIWTQCAKKYQSTGS